MSRPLAWCPDRSGLNNDETAGIDKPCVLGRLLRPLNLTRAA